MSDNAAVLWLYHLYIRSRADSTPKQLHPVLCEKYTVEPGSSCSCTRSKSGPWRIRNIREPRLGRRRMDKASKASLGELQRKADDDDRDERAPECGFECVRRFGCGAHEIVSFRSASAGISLFPWAIHFCFASSRVGAPVPLIAIPSTSTWYPRWTRPVSTSCHQLSSEDLTARILRCFRFRLNRSSCCKALCAASEPIRPMGNTCNHTTAAAGFVAHCHDEQHVRHSRIGTTTWRPSL